MHLIEIHLRDLLLVKANLSCISMDHVARISSCRHAVEIGVFYSLQDIRPDMQTLCKRNNIYTRTFTGNSELISI